MSDRYPDWPARLKIDPTAFIAGGAVVVGEVTLGARSSVWFNTVVRGDSAAIEIGEDSNVQDNSTVHVDEGLPAIVGRRVTIGHRAIVHGCVIEDDVLVGMGAVVLSGARIGAGSLIGASALVREGQAIPPGSLALGAPARVIGPVGEAHREAIATGARHYVELSRTYLKRGFGAAYPPVAWHSQARPLPGEAMSELEWAQRLDVLRAGPALASAALAKRGIAAFRRKPAPDRWSAIEVLAHVRDSDAEVLLPRIERVLAEEFPAVPDIAVETWAETRGYHAADPAATIADWAAVRARMIATLAPLGPRQWRRPLVHSTRGPHTLGDVVRYACEHDLSHRRQWQAALEAGDMILAPGPLDPPADRLLRALAARGERVAASPGALAPGPGPVTLAISTGPFVLDLAGLVAALGRRPFRVLVLSRLGAHPDARASGLQRLWRLEEHARGGGAPTLTLRFAPLLAPDAPLWLRLRSRPALPRGGRTLVNPALESDAVETIVRALADPEPWRDWYEVAGPEVWSLAELRALAAESGPARERGAWAPALEEMMEHRLAESGPWCERFGITPGRIAGALRGRAA